jgi:hypothetical protein
MSIIDRLTALYRRLMGAGAEDLSLIGKHSDHEERRHRERRGQLQDAQNQLKSFIYEYWSRFYTDFPENDRRKLQDRRQLNSAG